MVTLVAFSKRGIYEFHWSIIQFNNFKSIKNLSFYEVLGYCNEHLGQVALHVLSYTLQTCIYFFILHNNQRMEIEKPKQVIYIIWTSLFASKQRNVIKTLVLLNWSVKTTSRCQADPPPKKHRNIAQFLKWVTIYGRSPTLVC